MALRERVRACANFCDLRLSAGEAGDVNRLIRDGDVRLVAIREYVEAQIAEADASAEAGIREPDVLWPQSVLDAKVRVIRAYEDLVALARNDHAPSCGVWHELDDVTGLLHAVGTCDCILSREAARG